MTDTNAGYVSFRKPAKEILMDRAQALSKARGVKVSLPAYLMECSEHFERCAARKRDV